ncbi:MAG TPA: M28 family peptidase [Flavipsychrobacter sp.]|nr:M28 family peptidase [Flavipsychrobacter sp.]
MKRYVLAGAFLIASVMSASAQDDSLVLRTIANEVLLHGACYDNLRDLCTNIGHRLSGTPQAEKAVQWAKKELEALQPDRVWLQPVTVPVWFRGKESLSVKYPGKSGYEKTIMLSLGNSEGTKGKILEAAIVMVNSPEELKALSPEAAKGKIIFFNNRFPQELINTFEGYGMTARYRSIAPNIAATKGAAGIIIRSVSTGADDQPHTGAMRYADSVTKIPAIAIGNISADKLEAACKKGTVQAQLQSECTMKGTASSYNVIAEIKGSEQPDEIVLVGGHLDSWDVGDGAHDDGAGITQSIEVIRTLKALKIRPKRTVRAVLFMNEENGLKGGLAYADSAKANNEKHILAIESDAGGFSPRGMGTEMDAAKREKIKQFAPLFRPYGVYDFDQEEGGADISPLHNAGVPTMALLPDPQRYFDYHHTHADTFDKVNHRELKLGAVTMTQMVYLIATYGL